MDIRQRLTALRDQMAQHKVDAYIVPSSDPHQSEYPPRRWTSRAWISGFAGSAGTVVVTQDSAGLWVDSRYYLIAEEAIAGTEIELFKVGQPEVPSYEDWLADTLEPGATVSFDGLCMSVASSRSLDESLSPKGIAVRPGPDLFEDIWTDRPGLPNQPIYAHDVRFAGQSRGEKLSAIRAGMTDLGATHHAISTLDDIAWLLNLRGSDIPYNPCFVGHLILDLESVRLFVTASQLEPALQTELQSAGVHLEQYGQMATALSELPDGAKVIVSPTQMSVAFLSELPAGVTPIEQANLTTRAKACKNATEIGHIRSVMVRDGLAMVRFLHWLDTTVGNQTVTEISAEQKLAEFRAIGENYVGEAFRTISAYRGHGASPHYASSAASDVHLEPAGIYLVDSGGQYLDGTTDITRTVTLGNPTDDERRDYTLVLKGHIDLATMHFPKGTSGKALDVITRQHLWKADMTYLHGTGHGVGFFLNVHEGPQRIAEANSDEPLAIGMLTSNEPGLYRPERYGIRVENLIVVQDEARTAFGQFLSFETVTLCPFDTRLICVEMLSEQQRAWVDAYHRMVRDRLLGHLEPEVGAWLERACRPL